MKLSQKHQQQLTQILQPIIGKSQVELFVFGSMASGKAWRGSDLDIGVEGEIDDRTIGNIKQALHNSTLPYTVDVVDFNDVSESFKKSTKDRIRIL